MFSKLRFVLAGVAVASALVLSACGGNAGGGGGGGGSVTVTAGDGLAFNQTTLTIPANTATTVTFQNTSSGLQHNWVLVKGGDDIASQVDAAAAGAAPDYVPDGDPNIAAASDMLNGGGSDTVEVPALPAGTYTYMCTFPGHYAGGMKGTLTVQ